MSLERQECILEFFIAVVADWWVYSSSKNKYFLKQFNGNWVVRPALNFIWPVDVFMVMGSFGR